MSTILISCAQAALTQNAGDRKHSIIIYLSDLLNNVPLLRFLKSDLLYCFFWHFLILEAREDVTALKEPNPVFVYLNFHRNGGFPNL